MKKTLSFSLLTICYLLFATCHAHSQAKFQTLNEIQYAHNSVTFKLSAKVEFKAFKLPKPLRLVIDFTDVELKLKTREFPVKDNPNFTLIRAGQFRSEPVKIARAVIELKSDVPYQLKAEGNDVLLSFVGKAAPEKIAEKPEPPAKAPETKKEEPATPPPVEVVAVPVEEEKKVVKSPESVIPVPKEVKKKPAPPTETQKKQAKPKELTPVKKEVSKPAKTTLPTTLVSFDFHDADIKDVLRVLSNQSRVNIISGPDVTGNVTVALKRVPFDQAFNTILKLGNLVSQEVGPNIIRVMTPDTLTRERAQAVTFTKLFPLNYAKAEDVKTQLDAIRGAEGRRGIISVDQRTNTLIITDTPEGLASAEKLIIDVDKKPYQVLIEAKLVEVNLSNRVDLGIDWTFSQTSERTPVSGGRVETLDATQKGGQVGINFGIVTDNMKLEALLSVLSAKGVTRLLSNPRVTTLNNQEARILVGQRVPYVQQTTQLGTASGGVTSEVQWLEVGIRLNVVPTINVDRQVTLRVSPQVSLLVRIDPAGPVIGTREAETTVMVRDNETVVIGGLIREEDAKAVSQVPLLGDIPILGALFKKQIDTKERSELLVFITPKIIDD